MRFEEIRFRLAKTAVFIGLVVGAANIAQSNPEQPDFTTSDSLELLSKIPVQVVLSLIGNSYPIDDVRFLKKGLVKSSSDLQMPLLDNFKGANLLLNNLVVKFSADGESAKANGAVLKLSGPSIEINVERFTTLIERSRQPRKFGFKLFGSESAYASEPVDTQSSVIAAKKTAVYLAGLKEMKNDRSAMTAAVAGLFRDKGILDQSTGLSCAKNSSGENFIRLDGTYRWPVSQNNETVKSFVQSYCSLSEPERLNLVAAAKKIGSQGASDLQESPAAASTNVRPSGTVH